MAAGVLRDESWTIPLVACASVNVVSISLFEAYILAKTLQVGVSENFVGQHCLRHGRKSSNMMSRRQFFLGQSLLFGLFCSSLVGLIFVAPTTSIVCGVTRQLGVGLVGAATFAPMLVKCVFLVSLHGGVYLPSTYLSLLLFFAIGVQLALNVQWLFLRPPNIVQLIPHSPHADTTDTHEAVIATFSMSDARQPQWSLLSQRPICNTSFGEFLSGLAYVAILILCVLFISLKLRHIRDNYRESVYIASSSISVLVIWVITIMVTVINGVEFEDPCIAFALEATSTVIFLVMFSTKGRRMAAMGRESVYVGDGDIDRIDDRGTLSPPVVHTAPEICNTIGYAGDGGWSDFYNFPSQTVVNCSRPAFMALTSCDRPSEGIYRIPVAVPDYMSLKKMPSASIDAHCRRHGAGPLLKHTYVGYGQTLPKSMIHNSMLY